MTTLDKSIQYDRASKDFKAELDGQLIGFFGSYHAAEVELNRVAYERLIDGDFATAAEMDAPIDPPAPEPNPLGDEEGDDPDAASPLCGACDSAEYPPSALRAGICVGCANAQYHGLPDRFAAARMAHSRQSAAIESRIKRCVNCDGPHFTWQCSEIAARLFAPPQPEPRKDVALGRELCRMKWRNFRAFVALLLSVPTEHLVIYAASYQAFIREYRPDSDLTINDVLQAWARDMQRVGEPAASRLAA